MGVYNLQKRMGMSYIYKDGKIDESLLTAKQLILLNCNFMSQAVSVYTDIIKTNKSTRIKARYELLRSKIRNEVLKRSEKDIDQNWKDINF